MHAVVSVPNDRLRCGEPSAFWHSPSPGRNRRVPFNGPKLSDPVARATEPTAEERADERAAAMTTAATAVHGLRGDSGPSIS